MSMSLSCFFYAHTHYSKVFDGGGASADDMVVECVCTK